MESTEVSTSTKIDEVLHSETVGHFSILPEEEPMAAGEAEGAGRWWRPGRRRGPGEAVGAR